MNCPRCMSSLQHICTQDQDNGLAPPGFSWVKDYWCSRCYGTLTEGSFQDYHLSFWSD